MSMKITLRLRHYIDKTILNRPSDLTGQLSTLNFILMGLLISKVAKLYIRSKLLFDDLLSLIRII